MAQSNLVTLTRELIKRRSLTPEDAGCQTLIRDFLSQYDFENESMIFEDTTNLWARRGTEGPVFCFAGHTDVVPTGNESHWLHAPFAAVYENGFIHGRGAADMKGSLAAMLVATERFINEHPNHKGSIAFLITSDEEGDYINGTTRVIDTLEARKEKIHYCIVGEPSSTKHTGDIIKNGRRGSLTGKLLVKGIQGHVAYPHLAQNPIHNFAPALTELSTTVWDSGNRFFPPTTFQVADLHSGTGTHNLVPGQLEMMFNFRFSNEVTHNELQERVIGILDKHCLSYEIEWLLNGQPFLTPEGKLVEACQLAIKEVMGFDSELSTCGGTSDGRFIAPTGAEVVEVGPENNTIHKVNEKVSVANLESLVEVYYKTMVKLLS